MSEEATVENRRVRGGPPPTMAMQAYQSLDPFVKRAMQVIGLVLAPVFLLLPIVMEGVFERDLWIGLWLIDYGVAVPMCVLLIVPPLGFKLLGILPGILTKLIPSGLRKYVEERPDRRGERAE